MNNNRKKLIVGIVYYVLILVVGWFLFKNNPISLELAQLLYALIFFLVLPMILIKKGFGEKTEDFNLPVKLFKKQLFFVAIIVFISGLLIWLFMLQWGGSETAKKMIWWNKSILMLAGKNLLILPIGLFAQEFFFRGFLLNIFRKNFNNIFSVIVVALLFAIFNSILLEVLFGWQKYLGLFVFGLLLGWIVVKLRSVIFSFFIYWWGMVLLGLWVLVELGRRI